MKIERSQRTQTGMSKHIGKKRTAPAVFGLREVKEDPKYEKDFANDLKKHPQERILSYYAVFRDLPDEFGATMRRIFLKALCKRFGNSCTVEPGVNFKHPDTFDVGNAVFIGRDAYLQGWYKGSLKIGDHVWIGPNTYLHCCDLVIEDYVGIGPGVKVLGNEHVGKPVDVPILKTRLEVNPVRIKYSADIGMGACILPGVTIGRGAIIGAGATVTKDIPDYSIAVGVPAEVIKKRK